MFLLSIVLPINYQISSVANIIDVFEEANHIQSKRGESDLFKIQLIQAESLAEGEKSQFQDYKIKTTRGKDTPNLLLIPAIKRRGLKENYKLNGKLVKWIQEQYKNGAEVASLCTGAYIFAETGILNAKIATTHVDFCSHFILTYPLIYTKPGRTLTVDWNCYTSGGSTSSFHLLIYLIQKFYGNEIAVKVSKTFAIELDRYHQSYFSTFRPIYSHNDDLVTEIQKQLESNYTRISTIDEVTREFPASRRNLVRRFIKATGIPPIQYLQNVRIEKAKQLLENSDLSVTEVIGETGYTDPKSFRKVFLKLVGITPLAYREKFRVA